VTAIPDAGPTESSGGGVGNSEQRRACEIVSLREGVESAAECERSGVVEGNSLVGVMGRERSGELGCSVAGSCSAETSWRLRCLAVFGEGTSDSDSDRSLRLLETRGWAACWN
jgi:hypothetical protein